ncbi:MAG: hypothetical protein IPJ92_03035 [Veillonella sp.]|nr:hypothetical protein [Veillonella sp.]
MDERQFRNEDIRAPLTKESVKQQPFIQDSGQTQQRFQPAAYSAQEEYERSTYDSEHSETHRHMSPGHAEEPHPPINEANLLKSVPLF